jgi:hypothetical protein
MSRCAVAILAVTLELTAACSGESKPPSPAVTVLPPAAPPAAAPAADHAHAAPSADSAELLPVPAGAKIGFVSPSAGEQVVGPLENGKVAVLVQMSAEGIAVKPAGPVEAGSGHHHILIDVPDAIPAGSVVPSDDQHLHFGQGQTEATVALAPGAHKLTLQFADGMHRSYGPSLAATIEITVAGAGTVGATAP